MAALSDLFGIQARGGCSCAGPYGHRLLAIDAERSHALDREISLGCEGIKPGWTRINFNYFITETVRDYLIDTVDLLARHGHRLLPAYRFDPASGLWHHRRRAARPLPGLDDLRFTLLGIMTGDPAPSELGEDVLPEQLRSARRLLETLPDEPADGTTGLPAGFEALRWFPLPPQCLDDLDAPASSSATA